MKRPEKINISNYIYPLPDDRIAKFPLTDRDNSKLLVYRDGNIDHRRFKELPDLLERDTLLIFNETRVIYARLILQKPSGAAIQVFVLEPVSHSGEVQQALASTDKVTWKCMIGNKKKFRQEDTLELEVSGASVTVSWKNRVEDEVLFEWNDNSICFGDILEKAGKIPLPPYLDREVVEDDKQTYQTVYARVEGSVAAPTAGLHFTPGVLSELEKKNIKKGFVTLHVGAGTFKPVYGDDAIDHLMHSEHVFFTRSLVQQLLNHSSKVVPVGTTSMRSLESLYWFGAGLINSTLTSFDIPQYFPYEQAAIPVRDEALARVLQFMDEKGIDTLTGTTSIYIVPGYEPQLCNGLVTNFHMSGSTLILLVGALTGNDWKRIYEEALENNYRFLSYGDSSLLWF